MNIDVPAAIIYFICVVFFVFCVQGVFHWLYETPAVQRILPLLYSVKPVQSIHLFFFFRRRGRAAKRKCYNSLSCPKELFSITSSFFRVGQVESRHYARICGKEQRCVGCGCTFYSCGRCDMRYESGLVEQRCKNWNCVCHTNPLKNFTL